MPTTIILLSTTFELKQIEAIQVHRRTLQFLAHNSCHTKFSCFISFEKKKWIEMGSFKKVSPIGATFFKPDGKG
jgi:hypothetical protein